MTASTRITQFAGLRRFRLAVPAFAAVCLTLLSGQQAARADEYPSRAIKLVVPFPVGGSSDYMGRMLSDKLAPILKQPVVVENKAGAGGMIGTDAVAKSPADGYSFVLVDVFHTTTPVYTRRMPYDAVRDFTPVSLVARSPLFLVASPAFEPKTLPDLITWSKANPGRLTIAIAGTGSVVTDLFRARSGLQFTMVPYKGAAPAIQDLMAGQVNGFISTMASAGTQVKAGRVRVMAVTGNRRNADFPDVPTFAETGIAGMDYEQWFGVLGPAGLPKSVVDKMSGAIGQVLKMPDVRERLATMALEVASPEPEEMRRKVEGDFAQWQKLARELDIKPLD